jgi:hypothetical protein
METLTFSFYTQATHITCGFLGLTLKVLKAFANSRSWTSIPLGPIFDGINCVERHELRWLWTGPA